MNFFVLSVQNGAVHETVEVINCIKETTSYAGGFDLLRGMLNDVKRNMIRRVSATYGRVDFVLFGVFLAIYDAYVSIALL